MSTQKRLRDRLRSVNNMLHITQAMEIVASVRFRKLMHTMEHFRFYSNKLEELIGRLKMALDIPQHPLFQNREKRRLGVIVIAGDKGLCGSYNDHVLKEADRFLRQFETSQVELILFGHKAVDHFKHQKWSIKSQNIDFSRHLTEGNVKEWTESYSHSFEGQEYDQLWIIYTHFKNVVSRQVKVEKILPLENTKSKAESRTIDFIFEPDPARIYESMIPLFFYAKFQLLLFESYASELSARMVAMKSATKNAEEMIESLTLIKNKNRQLSITREILEITAGAEGLK